MIRTLDIRRARSPRSTERGWPWLYLARLGRHSRQDTGRGPEAGQGGRPAGPGPEMTVTVGLRRGQGAENQWKGDRGLGDTSVCPCQGAASAWSQPLASSSDFSLWIFRSLEHVGFVISALQLHLGGLESPAAPRLLLMHTWHLVSSWLVSGGCDCGGFNLWGPGVFSWRRQWPSAGPGDPVSWSRTSVPWVCRGGVPQASRVS